MSDERADMILNTLRAIRGKQTTSPLPEEELASRQAFQGVVFGLIYLRGQRLSAVNRHSGVQTPTTTSLT